MKSRERSLKVCIGILCASLAMGLAPRKAGAHAWMLCEATALFKADGTYQIDFQYDVDALLGGFPPGHMTEEGYDYIKSNNTQDELDKKLEEARDGFSRTLRVRFDDEVVRPEILYPELGEGTSHRLKLGDAWPGMKVRLSGSIPPGAKIFTFFASKIYGPVVLRLKQEGIEEEEQQVTEIGEKSAPYEIKIAVPARVQSPSPAAHQDSKIGEPHNLSRGWVLIAAVLGLAGLIFFSIQIPRRMLWDRPKKN